MLEPIFNAHVQQAVFRAALKAQSFPGRCVALPESAVQTAAHRALLAALLDAEVSLADPQNLLCAKADWPFLEARPVDAEHADFILLGGENVRSIKPRIGTLEEPEKSASLVLIVGQIGANQGLELKLTGPGIQTEQRLHVEGLAREWLNLRQNWNTAFPMGVDIYLAGSNGIVALPRTTQIEVI